HLQCYKKTTEISPKRSSKSASHSLLQPFGDVVEKKPSSSMFKQMEKKNPSCPAMALKLADNVRTVSNKATTVTDEQAVAANRFNTIAQ
ncbi:hypothetical protein DVH24_042471, partial [Malus domestica]